SCCRDPKRRSAANLDFSCSAEIGFRAFILTRSASEGELPCAPSLALRVNIKRLLAPLGFAKHEPVAVLAARVMRRLPARIDDRSAPDLDDAVAGTESHLSSCLDEVKMCPLIAMTVHVIRDFAKQDAFGPQNSIRLRRKGGIHEGKTVPL